LDGGRCDDPSGCGTVRACCADHTSDVAEEPARAAGPTGGVEVGALDFNLDHFRFAFGELFHPLNVTRRFNVDEFRGALLEVFNSADVALGVNLDEFRGSLVEVFESGGDVRPNVDFELPELGEAPLELGDLPVCASGVEP
jgi:hypothetical protein